MRFADRQVDRQTGSGASGRDTAAGRFRGSTTATVKGTFFTSGIMTPHARQRLTALNALLTLSAGDASLDEKLAKALDLVLQVTWVQTKQKGAIFLVEGSSTISMRAWQGFSDEMRERCATISVGVGVCGRVAEQKKELFAHNPGNESCGCFRNLPCYARYGMPIMAGSRVLGVIVQYVENESDADESGMDFLRAVASTLAGIIQRREAEDRIRDLLQKNQALARRLMVVQEEEYRRFARELHDEMGQSITAIKADAVLIATHCRDGRAEDVGRWATSIISVTDHIYEVIYAVIRRLRPCTLDELGLVAAVEDLLTNWQKRYPWLQFQFKPLRRPGLVRRKHQHRRLSRDPGVPGQCLPACSGIQSVCSSGIGG